jgi:hypothetical protein
MSHANYRNASKPANPQPKQPAQPAAKPAPAAEAREPSRTRLTPGRRWALIQQAVKLRYLGLGGGELEACIALSRLTVENARRAREAEAGRLDADEQAMREAGERPMVTVSEGRLAARDLLRYVEARNELWERARADVQEAYRGLEIEYEEDMLDSIAGLQESAPPRVEAREPARGAGKQPARAPDKAASGGQQAQPAAAAGTPSPGKNPDAGRTQLPGESSAASATQQASKSAPDASTTDGGKTPDAAANSAQVSEPARVAA